MAKTTEQKLKEMDLQKRYQKIKAGMFDPASYAKEKGYGKYFQKGDVWYGNVEGAWKTATSKEEARKLAGLGIAPGAGAGVGAGAGAGAGARVGAGLGEVTEDTKYKDLVLKALEDYLTGVSGQKPWQELYTEKAEELGIPGKQKVVTGLQQEVLDVEGLLDKLEEDVGTRIGGRLVTGAEERRQLAIEGKPLREQMADLMRAEARAGAGLTGARGELATMMGLEEQERAGAKTGLELLPLFKEALTYEDPEEAFARMLKEEEAKKEAGVSPYVPKEPTYPTSYREWELAGKPGTYEDWLQRGAGAGVTVGSVLGLDKTTAAKFSEDLEQEIKNVYDGKYGFEGSRERALNNLVSKYPGIGKDKIGEVIYGSANFEAAFPDGYESQIKGAEEKTHEENVSKAKQWLDMVRKRREEIKKSRSIWRIEGSLEDQWKAEGIDDDSLRKQLKEMGIDPKDVGWE